MVCGSLAAPASAQVEATFPKLTAVKASYTVLPKADTVRRAVFSPDGLKVATVDARGVLRVLAVQNPEKAWSFPPRDDAAADAASVAWSVDGKFIITGHQDGTVRKLAADTGEKVWQNKRFEGPVNDVAVNRDADVVAAASDDKTVRLFDAKGEQTWISKHHADKVLSVDLTYNGKFVLSGDAAGVLLLCGAVNEPEKTTPLIVRRFPKSDVAIVRVALDPKTSLTDPLELTGPGKTVGDPGTDPIKLRLLAADRAGVVTYYDLEKTKPMRQRKFSDAVVDIGLSPADKDSHQTAIVGTKKGTFAYRPQDADAAAYQLEFALPFCVAIADDGRTALVGGAPTPNADKVSGAVHVFSLN
jgi:hypothetical protein